MSTPVRLVIGIDGTWCTPDGPHGRGKGNWTNVYRLCASIKRGVVEDLQTSTRIEQRVEYVGGAGSKYRIGSLTRLQAGFDGHDVPDMIRDVYEKCCVLGGQDEIWFYGFSRGAFVARAVAGMLYRLGCLSSAGSSTFRAEYDRALKIYASERQASVIGPGQIHYFLKQKTKSDTDVPKVKFVGVFDTVKAVNDKKVYDISMNGVQHFRQALAMNENRIAMTPEYLYPNLTSIGRRQTFIQAWFAGAHIDLGGSARRDGLSLYPLQWILLESVSKGLVLDIKSDLEMRSDHRLPKSDDPLQVVMLSSSATDPTLEQKFTTTNKISTSMFDLRSVNKRPGWNGNYEVVLNLKPHHGWTKKPRDIFRENALCGYCPWAAMGTIIHPSVFQLLEDNDLVSEHAGAWSPILKEKLAFIKDCMLGTETTRLSVIPRQPFWTSPTSTRSSESDRLRILVCGNTGVGKSTLINLVFGFEITESSDNTQGQHDIETALVDPRRPGLVVHDSRGFEAGSADGVGKVKKFLQERAKCIRMSDRLHVIWFCFEMSSNRVRQDATEKLFNTLSEYCDEIPIVIVATKIDLFTGMIAYEKQDELIHGGTPIPEAVEQAKDFAATACMDRLKEHITNLSRLDDWKYADALAVSSRDPDSIKRLTEVTYQCFAPEKLRIIYVAAQVANIDLKIQLSIVNVMKTYRNVLYTTTGLSAMIPGGPTIIRVIATADICGIVVKAFGAQNLAAGTFLQIVKHSVWDDAMNLAALTLGESVTAFAWTVTALSGGMVPVFPMIGALNIPILVPAITRLMLMIAADFILILTRAFKLAENTCERQPQESDVRQAAKEYSQISSQVHKEILQLVPRFNLRASYRVDVVKNGLEGVLREHRNWMVKTAGKDTDSYGTRSEVSTELGDDLTSTVASMQQVITDVGAQRDSLRTHNSR